MIANETDFKSSLETLKTPLSISLSDLSAVMYAEEENYNNASIYQALNSLYERIRVLEDVRQYCQTYVYNTIQNKKKSFKSIIQNIEQNKDMATSSKRYFTMTPEWSSDVVTDRSGKTIYSLDTHMNPTGDTKYIADITAYENSCDVIPYKIDSTKTQYIAQYRTNKAEPIYSEVVCILDKPTIINFIQMSVTNADCIVTCITDTDEQIDVPYNQYFAPVLTKKIYIDIMCNRYISIDTNISDNRTDSLSSLDTTDLVSGASIIDMDTAQQQAVSTIDTKQYRRNLNEFTKAWEKINGYN